MGISTQRVKLDISKQASMQVIRLGQGDKNGTTLVAELFDNGNPYNLSGKTARFTMRTPDGRSSYSVASSSTSSNTATFNIDERYAASVAGTTDVAYIEVLSGSTVICSTSRMRVICLQSATEGVSPSQMHDNGLDAAIAAANTAASSANTAASNANTKASRAETATTGANTARDNANTAASAANTAASAATTAAGSATTAAEAANSAKDAANAAATAANTAAGSANAATSEANAAIEAMGDISELAVPEMTASVRGGAKVGGSTQVISGKLEVKLSESATGTSVTTGSTSALRELQVHGKSVQDGTPTPDAPVPVQVVEGRNLLPNISSTNRTHNGVAFSISENRIVASGTSTALAESNLITLDAPVMLEAGKQYTILLSGKYSVSGSSTLFVFYDESSTAVMNSGSQSNGVWTFTPTATMNLQYMRFRVNAAGATVSIDANIQLEEGSTATPYVPYGSIGIVIGGTATSIDLQDNTLAFINDTYRDTLNIDSTGHIMLTKRTGSVDITSDFNWIWASGFPGPYVHNLTGIEKIPSSADDGGLRIWSNRFAYGGTYMANRGRPYVVCLGLTNNATDIVFYPGDESVTNVATWKTWLDQHPTTLVYPLADTAWETTDLGYIDPPAIPSGSVVTISASLTPTFDLDCWTEHASELADITDAITTLAGMVIGDEQESIASSIAPVEGSTASANHAVGDYLMLGARLYRVTTAIASGERITPGTNVTGTTVMSEIVSLLS